MNFYFSIRPRPEKRFLEGSGDLSDITIIMEGPGVESRSSSGIYSHCL
jgi:hypothetical protein